MSSVFELMELIWTLKELERSGWKYHKVSGLIETTASHTFGVMLLVWLFAKKERANMERALKMALVHDLVESVIGDLTPRDAKTVDRDRVEAEGLQTMEAKVPDQLRDEIRSLIGELHAERTRESRIVRACDRLDTAFQAFFYRKTDRLSESAFKEFLRYAEEKCGEGFAGDLIEQLRSR